MGLAQWNDVDSHRAAKGEMDAVWQRLGDAAGATTVGLNRVKVAPGKLPTPPHSHGASEELFFVLAGDGLAWQDDAVHEVRPGDCVIHRPNELEHTFVAGNAGLEYLVFGTRHPTEIGWLPRSRAIRFGWPWAEGRDDDPWDVEAQSHAAGGGRAGRPTAEHPERRRGGARGHGSRRPVGAAGDPRAQRPVGPALGAPGGRRDRIAAALPLRGGGDCS